MTGLTALGAKSSKARLGRGSIVLAVAVLATTTACGGSGSSKAASLPTSMSGLYAQAKKDGVVYWSAPKPQAQMQAAIDLFTKKYPGVKVKYTNTKAPDQVSQIKLEQAAKKVTVDVANAGGLTVPPSLKLADNVDWAKYGISGDDIFEKNMVYIWAVPKVWAYNTSKVKASEVPKTWNDLLDARWSGGKVSAEGRASFMTVWDLDSGMGGESKATAWAKNFAKLKPHYTDNTTQSEAPIESGQVYMGTSLINLVLSAQKKGAPVAVAPLSPTNANEAYLYVPKYAPHPAAAVLLTSFLSSDAAQAALAKSYNSRIPVSTDCSHASQTPVLKAICAAGLKWYPTKSLKQYNDLSAFFPKAEDALGTNVG